MKKKIHLLFVVMLLVVSAANAQIVPPPVPPPPPPGLPLDGGLGALLLAGLFYGYKKIKG